MGLSKDKLIYDSTTPSDGDSVAAFLRTGTSALTSTIAGSLDVNVTNLTAADVDIRDLVFATDKVDVGGSVVALDAGTLAALENITVIAAGNVADDAIDSGNPFKIGTRAVSGALAAVSASGDRADGISDLYRRLWVNNAPNIAGSNASVTVDDTAGGIVIFTSVLAGRTRAIVKNMDNKPLYLGFGTVTVANGMPVEAGASWSGEIGPDLILKGIRDTGETGPVKTMQFA